MTKSKTTWARLVACAVFVNYLLTAGLAGAVHPTVLPPIFELDGTANGGYNDWENVLTGDGGDSLVHLGPVSDPPEAPRIFSSGGSKDINDINQWKWAQRDGGPDKNELTNAYAATYTDTRLGLPTTGHQILYFGADRYDNSGNAQLGFWFFRQSLKLNPNGTFDGVHTAGDKPDILILSNFVNGGAQSIIQVYKWVGSGGSHGSLDLLTEGVSNGTVVCDAGDAACATANALPTQSPWPYTAKNGSVGSFPPLSFVEGGIDLTALGLEGCISSFVAETRSSQSETAVLKDFILGETFNTCGISATKSCAITVDPSGTAVTVNFGGQVCNDGPITVTDLSVTDSIPDANVTLTGTTLSPKGLAGECVDFSGSYSSSTLTNSDTVTVTGTVGDGSEVRTTADATCSLSTSPAITVSKTCTAAVNPTGSDVKVSFSGEVCNTGNVALTDITVTDDQPNNPTLVTTIASLAPNTCQDYSGTYNSNTLTNDDTITATGIGALGSGPVSDTESATCIATTTPALTVSKSCTAAVNPTGSDVKISFSGEVCNTGNVTLTDITVNDDQPNNPTLVTTIASLAPNTCQDYSGNYNSNTASNTDTITASGTAVLGSGAVSNTGSTTCDASTTPALTVSKNCTASVNPTGSSVNVAFSGEVCNTGNVTVTDITVNDNQPNNPTLVTTIASLAPTACQAYSGSYTSATASNSDTITASGTGVLSSGAVSNTGSTTCDANLNAGLTVTKTCETDLQLVNNLVAVKVNFGGKICNTGSTVVSGLTLVNDKPNAATSVALSQTDLAPGACLDYNSSYSPTNISSGTLATPSSAMFKDTVNVSGTAAFVGPVSATSGEVSCPLCQ